MGRPRKKPQDPFGKTEPGKVKVKSLTYGLHFRAPRGSIKEAKLNNSMQQASLHTQAANNPTRLINNALKPFREDFPGGLFFQFLQAHFNRQASKGEKFSLKNLLADADFLDDEEDAEEDGLSFSKNLHQKYPHGRLVKVFINAIIDRPHRAMHLSVNHQMNARVLERSKASRSIKLTFILLFPDFENNDIRTEAVSLPLKKLDDPTTYSFMMDIPAPATSYMLFWKAALCENGIEEKSISSKTMVLEQVGELPAQDQV